MKITTGVSWSAGARQKSSTWRGAGPYATSLRVGAGATFAAPAFGALARGADDPLQGLDPDLP